MATSTRKATGKADASKPEAKPEAKEKAAPKPKTGPVHDLVGRWVAVEDGTCGDGCGQPVKRPNGFAPGHDARLKSVLLKAGVLIGTGEQTGGGFVIADNADDQWDRWTRAMAILNG